MSEVCRAPKLDWQDSVSSRLHNAWGEASDATKEKFLAENAITPMPEAATLRSAAEMRAAKGNTSGAVMYVLNFTERPPSADDILELKGASASIGAVENRIRKIATPDLAAAREAIAARGVGKQKARRNVSCKRPRVA